jgi:hypothetical protein
MDLTPDLKADSVQGFFRIASNGFFATKLKNHLASNPSEFSRSILPSGLVLKDSINLSRMSGERSMADLKFVARTNLNMFDDKVSVQPFCSFPIQANPLSEPTRTYPVDMTYKQETIFQTNLHIPDGYKVIRMPENVIIDNDMVKIQLMTNLQDNGILILMGSYEFKKDVYPTPDYEEVRGYFRTIVDIFNEDVVLQKTTPGRSGAASL